MNDIELRYLVPLHDAMTLIVFLDRTVNTVDCTLLRNKHRALMPSLNPSLSEGATEDVLALEQELKAEIGASQYREYPDGETITIELDDLLFRQIKERCEQWGLTFEKLIQAFLRFCTEENKTVLKRWINDLRLEELHRAYLFVKEHQYTQGEFEQSFDEIMEQIEAGLSPILIVSSEGKKLLIFEWEDYWKRMGWLYPPGEKEKAEEECRRVAGDGNQH
jgi:PHD/YefM family antitoxin component YafN of YafNO toxin-antitoxin module